jgi:mannose-1-phosphate guanylyltransferase
MAGGSGTRLWPLSRESRPKQFLNLTGDKSLLQQTILRLGTFTHSPPILVCNNQHRFLVAEQMHQLDLKCDILLEPEGKNTAPSIALAAMKSMQNGDDPILLVFPSDHNIENSESFKSSLEQAIIYTERGKLCTLGVSPDRPETGYGYIRKGKQVSTESTVAEAFEVKEFVEKPNVEIARSYLESSQYYWNSGIFVFKASVFLSELKLYSPDIYASCQRSIQKSRKDLDFIRIDEKEFEVCPTESVDTAVFEKTSRAVVVSLECGWNDIGSWSSLWSISDKDENGNCNEGDVLALDTEYCLIKSENRLVSTLGVRDLVIVETKDSVLVANKNSVQKVGELVKLLKARNTDEWKVHREVYRPWGKYDLIDLGSCYQVKRITVNPGGTLSLQEHKHRAEHWVVVVGSALVTKGDKTFTVTQNESTFISMGEIHALHNPNEDILELIEVQTGSYLGEDDIIRYSDTYGRN